MPFDLDKRREKLAEASGKCADGNKIHFAVENSEGKHIGVALIHNIDEQHGNFGPIAIQINVNERGKGYGVAVYQMLGNYMFNERRMHKWNSGYMEGNTGSAKLHKKIGFEVEGVRKDMVFINGKYRNEVILGITAERFFMNNK